MGHGQGGSPGRACHRSPPPDPAGCGLPGEEDLCTPTHRDGGSGAKYTGRAHLPARSHTWESSKFWAKWGQTGHPGSGQPAWCPGLGCGLRSGYWEPLLWHCAPVPPWGPTPSPARAGPSRSWLFDPPLASQLPGGRGGTGKQGGAGVPLSPPVPTSALAPCATHLFPATGANCILDLPCH